MRAVWLFGGLLLLAACSTSLYISYPGAHAIDGDTFRHNKERYRLRRYNAPELGEPGAEEAKRELQKNLTLGAVNTCGSLETNTEGSR